MLREITKAVLATIRDTLRSRAALVAENTLLRQQVIVFHRAAPHPRLKPRDRFTISAINQVVPVACRRCPPSSAPPPLSAGTAPCGNYFGGDDLADQSGDRHRCGHPSPHPPHVDRESDLG